MTVKAESAIASGMDFTSQFGCSGFAPMLLRSQCGLCLVALCAILQAAAGRPASLEETWARPPVDARLRAYWWWLNGNVTSAAITRDLEEMQAKGFGGAVIMDAGGENQDGNDSVPHGPTFFSTEWRELYKHALHEANRLGLELSLNIQSGWNLGGPVVKPEDAAKKLTWSEVRATGPAKLNLSLPEPKSRDGFYRDLFVIAFPRQSESTPPHRPIQHWEEKAVYKSLTWSAPDTSLLFQDFPGQAGEADTRTNEVVDLTGKLTANGSLEWSAPAGEWQILRFGYTIADHADVSTASEGWRGYALDVLDAGAFQRYWDKVVEPLIADAGPLAGHTLKYLHTDSWEVEAINWTPTLREEFRQRRGYDLLPFLPALADRIVESRVITDRFLDDFRKTLGDLAIYHHYRLFRDNAHKHGLQIHPESGGPHASPIDAQRCLGWDDAPMSEFWAWSWRHRVGDSNRFFIKQPASAAHTYGHRLVLGEGFTTIGPHWQETIWDNLKPSFDQALCEGLNLLVWHAVVCSPAEMGIPGQQYFAGTHFNPSSTWWPKSAPFLSYINRCQALLQQGLFVADACYYYGDHVPNFAQLKRSDPTHILPGYDYDVITEEALLDRAEVRDGRIVLPDGMSYRVLVLPNRTVISLPVLRKLERLVKAGATVIGPRPTEASGLAGFPGSDEEVARLARRVWDDCDGGNVNEHPFGKGRVISGRTARDVLLADGIMPDFEYRPAPEISTSPQEERDMERRPPQLNYIHRKTSEADIYFIASRTNFATEAVCTFRLTDKAPELWNPVTGEHRFATAYQAVGKRVELPIEFTPCGSWFVVFRDSAARHPATARRNDLQFETLSEIGGSWKVNFDPRWGGPVIAQFDHLDNWSLREEPGIKYYSGTATYQKTFDLPTPGIKPGERLFLDLGDVRQLAEVRLNSKNLGIVWSPPFRVDITSVAKASGNQLEIDVVNFWPNRVIGDQFLPVEKRFTRTNIRKLTRQTPLMDSGLLGPVRLLTGK
jgi:hypothetical protein